MHPEKPEKTEKTEKPRGYLGIGVRLGASAMAMASKRIEHRVQEHGLIGNLHTAALVCDQPCYLIYHPPPF